MNNINYKASIIETKAFGFVYNTKFLQMRTKKQTHHFMLLILSGGCFKTGPGWFKYFTGQVSFFTSILIPDHTYEFQLYMYVFPSSVLFSFLFHVFCDKSKVFLAYLSFSPVL